MFGVEFKFNDNDVWHKGILTKLSQLTNDSGFVTSASVPTKLSQLQNDIGAGVGVKITTSATAPTSPAPGDFWYKEV
jgi:formate-dependent phosphoribosylglycinamide formyltransferase (GAR transformylase)